MPVTRLKTRRVEKPWGREDLWPGFEDVAPGGEPVGEVWFQPEDGGDPELLVKYLFTSEKLSIQVHPDDAEAQARGYPRGKDEAWLILAAEPDATIAVGTLEPMTSDELRASALDGSIEHKVDWKAVRAGDFFYSPARTVHAIGPGLTLIEVQQNVDLTYRLYDYGRPRELHLDDGVAVSDAVPYIAAHLPEPRGSRTILADGPKFVLERWREAGAGTLTVPEGRPVWLVAVTDCGQADGVALEAGGVWSAKGGTTLELTEGCDLLVAYPDAGVDAGLWRAN